MTRFPISRGEVLSLTATIILAQAAVNAIERDPTSEIARQWRADNVDDEDGPALTLDDLRAAVDEARQTARRIAATLLAAEIGDATELRS